MQLSRDTIQRMIGGTSISGGSSGGGGGVSPYILPLASDTVRGGLQIGYTQSGKNYPVQLDGEKAYVNVPWTDHYSWADITDKPATATRWPAWSEVTDKPSTFAPSSGSSYYLTRDAWWNVSDTHDANDLRSGIVFAYDSTHHSHTAVTGTLVAFSCRTNENYTLQLQGSYAGNGLYFRNRNGDGNEWQDWRTIIHSGNISSQSVNYATSAGKATNDGDGNTISSTYLKLIGGTLTGNLTVNPANANDSRIGVTNTNASGTAIYLLASTNRGVYHSTAGWLVATDGSNSFMDIGNVGIGTHSPGAKLGVAGGDSAWAGYFNGYSQSAVFLAHSGGNGAYICSKKNDTTYLFALYKNQTSLGSGGDVVMYARCDGNVGIGTTSPSQKLHISGGLLAVTNNSRTLTIGAQNSSAIHIYNDNNSTTFVNGGFSSNSNGSYDLGTTSYYWNVGYFNRIIAKSTTDAAAGSANHVALITGDPAGQHLEFDGNEIMSKATGTTTGVLYLNAEGGNVSINEQSGNCGIGTSSPSYKLHVSGQIYCTGGFTFLSDSRKKNIIDHDVRLSVDDIANAPLIHYTLKDDPEKRVRVGSIAQYWKRVLPESVNHAENGTLSMNYDLQAHASVIVLARKVRELERIIYNLQSRIA